MRQDQQGIDLFSQFMEEHPQEGQRVLTLNWGGQDLLNAGKVKEAERKFREAIAICEYAIPALNNLALCMQLRGDTKRAIRTAHRALEFHPTNVFAHCTLAECYQEMGRTEKARSHAELAINLLEDPDVPLDKLVKVLETMAKLQWDEKIIDIYRSYHEGIGFEDVLDGISWFYLGVAAANLGLIDEAIAHFGQAVNDDPQITLAELYIKTLRLIQDNKVPSFRFFYQTEGDKKTIDPKHPSEEIKPIVATGLWSKQEDDDYRHHIVALLGMWEDAWAEEFLRLILVQPKLPDDLKMHAATALIERGAIAEDERIEMFIDGMKQPVIINKHEIPAVSPEAVKQFELGLAQRQAGNITAAEKAYRRALEINPDFPEVLVNLANICHSTDRTEEGVRLLEKAVDLSESSTAILNLAAVYILEQGRIDEGSELLSTVSIDDIDEDLLPLYYRLIGQMHVFDGEFQAAREVFNKLVALLPNDEKTKDLLEWVARAEALRDDDMARWKQRRDRYLRQPVDPQMPLVMALQTLTKDNLIGITYWHDLSYGTLRKAELAQMIADYLLNEEIDIWEDISDEAWEVLGFLRGVGGSAPLAKLEEKFGSAEDDSIDWRYELPHSAIGELQAMGIVFVGQDTNKETIAFIPEEILQRMMAEI
ncbi:MAG TPA: tetratricopeptide repeat protein [Candidatus Acetothermia bacterium]|nr:tetratricopeptide repeat protein [Candidatus Acetothermia bacterium]